MGEFLWDFGYLKKPHRVLKNDPQVSGSTQKKGHILIEHVLHPMMSSTVAPRGTGLGCERSASN